MGVLQQPRKRILASSPALARWRPGGLSVPVTYAVLLLVVAAIGAPIYWMLLAAFKTNREVFTAPPTWLPLAPTLENFPTAWSQVPFGRFYINSLIYTLVCGAAKLLQALF